MIHTYSLLPPAAIADCVNGILTMEYQVHNTHFTLPLYANGSPTLVFQTVKGQRSGANTGHLTLYGQTVKAENLAIVPPFILIAYFLQPHTIKTLFGIDAGELTDKCADLDNFNLVKDTGIINQLLEEHSLSRQLELLNSFIMLLANQTNHINQMVLFATQTLKTNAHASALPELQKKLNISERSLQRLFEGHVGVSPKMYKRICQFNAAFQQLNQHHFKTLTTIAYQYGFADQSHYNRVFKEFTGITPHTYLNLSKPFSPKF